MIPRVEIFFDPITPTKLIDSGPTAIINSAQNVKYEILSTLYNR